MWPAVRLALLVVILWQGDASKVPTTPFAVESENAGGINIVLDPDKDSILATVEFLQNEQHQLKLSVQQSQAQMMAVVQQLQEDNSQLRKQQENRQAMVSAMLSDVSKEMREQQEAMGRQVQRQMSDLVRWVEEMRGQQEMVMEQAGLLQSVLEGVQEFQDWADNITSKLTNVQDRLTSVEASVLQLQGQGSDRVIQLTAVQQRMDKLESLLQSGRGSEAPSTSSPTTPVSSTTSSTTPVPSTTSSTTPVPSTPSPTTTTSTTTTSTTTTTTTTTTVSPDAAVGPLEFTIPPNPDLWGDSLITSVLVTRGGKLITGDIYQGKLVMSSLQTPEKVENVYELQKPWAMLELQDGTVAMTREHNHRISFFRLTHRGLEHLRDITTKKTYFGIAQGDDDTLIVSNRRTHTSASIDIIDMDGNVQRTLLYDVKPLIAPYCLKRFGDDVYVSDWVSRRVFRVNIYTGELKFTIGDLDLSDLEFYQPRKMDIDSDGNLYIATGGGMCSPTSFCIVQVTQSGSWKRMDAYVPQHHSPYPYGLEVTSSQIIISWGRWDGDWSSELTSYPLPELQEESVSESTPGRTQPPSKSTTPIPWEESGSGESSGDDEEAEASTPESTRPSSKLTTSTPWEVSGSTDSSGDGLTNVALNKPALQSTYHSMFGHPEKAVDGSRASAISHCTLTANGDSNPNRWWRVDLMGKFQVEAVVITNRGDCCGYRLRNFDIYVMEEAQLDPSESSHDPSDLCLHSDTLIADGATVRLACAHPIIGQYVSLVLRTDSRPLHFCEIEVLGRPAAAVTTQSIMMTTSGSSPSSSPRSTTLPPGEESGSEEGSGDDDTEVEGGSADGSGDAENDGDGGTAQPVWPNGLFYFTP